jgi:hypothetical protein
MTFCNSSTPPPISLSPILNDNGVCHQHRMTLHGKIRLAGKLLTFFYSVLTTIVCFIVTERISVTIPPTSHRTHYNCVCHRRRKNLRNSATHFPSNSQEHSILLPIRCFKVFWKKGHVQYSTRTISTISL